MFCLPTPSAIGCGVFPSCVFRLSRPHNSTLEGTSLSNRRPPSSSSLSKSLHTSLLFFLMIPFNAPQNIQNTRPLCSYRVLIFLFPGIRRMDVWSSLLMNACHFRCEIYFENFLKIRIWERAHILLSGSNIPNKLHYRGKVLKIGIFLKKQ